MRLKKECMTEVRESVLVLSRCETDESPLIVQLRVLRIELNRQRVVR